MEILDAPGLSVACAVGSAVDRATIDGRPRTIPPMNVPTPTMAGPTWDRSR